MESLRHFALHLAVWTLVLASFLLVTGWGGHGESWSVWARIPGVVAYALTLACFPAAIAVGARLLKAPDGVGLAAGLVPLLFGGLMLTGGVAGLNQVVVPRSLAATRAPEAASLPEVRAMTLPELRQHLAELAPEVRDLAPGGEVSAWQAANVAAFEHERRLAHTMLVPLLAAIGLMVGFWLERMPVAARIPTALAVAAGLLASIYLGGENGFEMVAVRVAGPAAFSAWFIVLAPAVLACGLGLPTVVALQGVGRGDT